MLYLIVGRTGSGKDTYAKYLEQYELKGVCSYTTRPKRTEYENSHIFISQDEVAKYEKSIVARTEINGYVYFATVDQLKEADYYIIDPNGIKYLNKHFPEIKYTIIYIYADDAIRKERALSRVDKKDYDKEKKVFMARNSSESYQFDEFEKNLLANKHIIIHNNNENNPNFLHEMVKLDLNLE